MSECWLPPEANHLTARDDPVEELERCRIIAVNLAIIARYCHLLLQRQTDLSLVWPAHEIGPFQASLSRWHNLCWDTCQPLFRRMQRDGPIHRPEGDYASGIHAVLGYATRVASELGRRAGQNMVDQFGTAPFASIPIPREGELDSLVSLEFAKLADRGPPQAGTDLDTQSVGEKRSPARHSSDFRWVNWYGTDYMFTKTQAACIGVLWAAWKNDTPELDQQTVLTAPEVDAESKRLVDLFKGHPAWGRMIVKGATQGAYRLRPPEPKN
jgi:hypothetical protein